MNDRDLDASGFLYAPIELVRLLVGRYVADGYDCVAMREIVSFVLSALVERELIARLTKVDQVDIGEVVLTLAQARARIEELRALPVF